MPGAAPWYCREKRVAIWMEAESDLGPVQIINSHFGLGRAERMLQAQLLIGSDWLGSIPAHMPTILLGDFNSVRTSRAYRVIAAQLRDVRTLVSPPGAFRTFPTRLPSLAVDHIFVNAALQPTKLSVHRTPLARIASDHFPLMAELTRSPVAASPKPTAPRASNLPIQHLLQQMPMAMLFLLRAMTKKRDRLVLRQML